jgi:hypothetical protein
MMYNIGGYFELELRKSVEYHKKAIRLNSGRNAFEYILCAREYKKVYLPYYTCDVMLEPLKKRRLNVEFYKINKQLEPVFDFSIIGKDETFVYTNYYGIKGQFINELTSKCPNLIIDNSQAFFDKPFPGIDTFYSARKFFGVPDGAYLFTEKLLPVSFPNGKSTNRFSHLIKRIEDGAQVGYSDFRSNEATFKNQPINLMSTFTQALLCNIDYKKAEKARKQNFLFLHENLKVRNELELTFDDDCIPMVYPLLQVNGQELKQKLIQNGVFVATYWPNVLKKVRGNDFESYLTEQTVFLPIDQRYGIKEMKNILTLIK